MDKLAELAMRSALGSDPIEVLKAKVKNGTLPDMPKTLDQVDLSEYSDEILKNKPLMDAARRLAKK